jgi:hypothetical protein
MPERQEGLSPVRFLLAEVIGGWTGVPQGVRP